MDSTIVNLLLIFVLNLVTSTLSQLKYMLASKSSSWQMYAIIGVDSIFYLYSLSLVIGDSRSLIAIFVLTLGKLLGVTTANLIEGRVVKKVYSYTLYVPSLDIAKKIEAKCFEHNISVTTMAGWSNGVSKYVVNMHLNPKQMEYIVELLNRLDVTITADLVEVSRVYGKIKERVRS